MKSRKIPEYPTIIEKIKFILLKLLKNIDIDKSLNFFKY
jgi:hypothetical protein